MRQKTLTAEYVAQAIFQAQERELVPNPFDEASILEFVKDVGVQVAARHFREIMARLSWGGWLDDIAKAIKAL